MIMITMRVNHINHTLSHKASVPIMTKL